jgi:iron complex outermembrane receptor protein
MNYHDRFWQLSQEIRINFTSDRLSGVAGLYYFDERAQTDRKVFAGSEIGFLPFGLTPGLTAQVQADVNTRSYAAFAAADWKLADALTLNLGGRFTHDRLRLRDYSTQGPLVFGLGVIPAFDDSQNADSLDPSIGLTFAAAPSVNLYARYARGYKSGGWNVDFINAAQFADRLRFRPERVDSGEIGLKHQGRDVRFSIAAYYMTIGDYQIDQFVDLGANQVSIELRNAARARSWGTEAQLEAQPIERLNLRVGVGYTNAKFIRFRDGAGAGIDLDGNRLPYAPRLTTSTELRYAIPLAFGPSLNLSADWTYRSKSFSGPKNEASETIDARHLVGARAALEGRNWQLSGWVRNLFGESYIDNRILDFFKTAVVERGEPRTYGVRAIIGF